MALPGPEVFERAGLKAWPGIEVEWDGHWVRRAAGGYTQRANSVQSLDPADDSNAEERIAAATGWFRGRGLPPIFRQTPLAGPNTIAALDAADWAAIDHSHLFAMQLGSVEPDPRGTCTDVLDPAFLAAQQRLQNYSDERLARCRALLAVIEVPACGVILRDNAGAPVATALMAIADGIGVTGNVITDPTRRREGFAAGMMRTGLAWAREHGATIAALNVAADNTAAHALYRGLGYRHQYDYLYRVPGRAK
jgi:N-acetylglutamate synthase